ncbi:NADP-dependent oxidoreductase [Streptomyces sp. WMMC500]|uniref:quinone oxidoreductase family protein n=1 Tax=Streptomyces sp. WMMC500 TaxID=3015154 RepID=UPI00248ADDBD|nr:NADP-dependent oxidoreductase [Streptomyces sp. WMMC500]WBB63068.1 NADP-dependent oxidoreductase [Streptomyces sp. WMMC500]
MRAVQIDRHGGPDALIVREIAEPALAPGEVIIRAAASSLNPVDWKTRAWQVGPRLPATLGRDLAGRVVAANDTAQEGGAPVIAMSAQIATGRGTWSDLVTLPGHLLAPAPSSIALADSASLPLTGTTALQALRSARTAAGERILVIGAAGAVGGLTVQLAHLAGAHVDALVSRSEHEPATLELGAEEVWHRPDDLPRGRYPVILDTAGTDASAALAPGGRYVSIADHPRAVASSNDARAARSLTSLPRWAFPAPAHRSG